VATAAERTMATGMPGASVFFMARLLSLDCDRRNLAAFRLGHDVAACSMPQLRRFGVAQSQSAETGAHTGSGS